MHWHMAWAPYSYRTERSTPKNLQNHISTPSPTTQQCSHRLKETTISMNANCWLLSKLYKTGDHTLLRRDTGFLVFSFPRSLGRGVYDEINGGQRKLVRTYLNYISTKFRPIWMRFGARVSKTPCQTLYPWVSVLARCFAYACTKSHPNRSKFGGDIAQINAHRFLLSPINFIINSTSQRPWEQKGQKTRVTP